MPSLRNALAETICKAIRNDKQTVFYLEDVTRVTYPGVPVGEGFMKDVLAIRSSISKKVEAEMAADIPGFGLLPLTEYYFTYHCETLPETEKDAQRCVAGVFPGMGPARGYKIPEADILTKVWRSHGDESALRHGEVAMNKCENVCESLGLESPKERLAAGLKQIAN